VTFDAQMHVGSLAMAAALLAAAAVAVRPRVRAAVEIGRLVPMRVVLEILEPARAHSYQGRPPFDVGRGRELDLVLGDPEVSRRHARFESRNGVVYVDDLKSSNGTFLNGRRVTEAIEVRTGDAVDVGTTRMLVESVRRWT
jgi:hypothetical protein